jgi:alkaline phosphatase D
MSVSPIKLIVTGSQVTNEASTYEGWHNFADERADFLKFLVDHKLSGVMLLTGDRHFTELLKTERPGFYPLYELTCSPILSGPSSLPKAESGNNQIVEGTFVSKRNFCTLEFTGPKGDRKITVRSVSSAGENYWQREIKLNELQPPKVAKP